MSQDCPPKYEDIVSHNSQPTAPPGKSPYPVESTSLLGQSAVPNPQCPYPPQQNYCPPQQGSAQYGLPQGQSPYPQGQHAYPQGQPSYPQGQQSYPQGQPPYPQGNQSYPQGQPSYPQGQQSYPQGQSSFPQGHNAAQPYVITHQPIMAPVLVNNHFGPDQVTMTCQSCHSLVSTQLTHKPGGLALLLCCLIFIFGGAFFCCLIPFCTECSQDVEHSCPNCKKHLGMYKRL